MRLVALGLTVALLLFFGCAQQTEQPAQPSPQQPAQTPQAPVGDTPVAPPAQPPADNVPLPPSTGSSDTPPPPPAASGITVAQLAAHNSPSDCWVAYKGNVYDVTSFIPQHKDGEIVIAQYCGTVDFEAGFTAKHGVSKVDKFMEVAASKGTFAG